MLFEIPSSFIDFPQNAFGYASRYVEPRFS